MTAELIIFLVVVAIIYFWYASIVSKKNAVLESLSGIDVQLKKRSNLIPNILKIAKKFMAQEKEIFTSVTELRTKVDSNYDPSDTQNVKQHLNDAAALDQNMGRLMLSMEDYPDLKSQETMIQAQKTYNEVEAQIAASRRFYNSSVTSLNNSIQIFPGNLIAGLAKATSMPFYEADDASKKNVNVDDII